MTVLHGLGTGYGRRRRPTDEGQECAEHGGRVDTQGLADSAPSAEKRGQMPGPLVGRERESQDLCALLENHRLVTVAA